MMINLTILTILTATPQVDLIIIGKNVKRIIEKDWSFDRREWKKNDKKLQQRKLLVTAGEIIIILKLY